MSCREAELEFIAHDWEIWARDDQLVPPQKMSSRPTRSGEPGPGLPARKSMAALGPGSRKRLARNDEIGSRPTCLGACGCSLADVAQARRVPAQNGFAASRAMKRRAAAGSPKGSRSAPRIALIGKTLADVRNVMVEGVSGLLAIHPRAERPLFEPSKRRLTWPNGAIAELFSADEPEGLRGPQFSAAWCDELAKWRGAEKAWDMLQFALRLGDAPQAVVTTTPRAIRRF